MFPLGLCALVEIFTSPVPTIFGLVAMLIKDFVNISRCSCIISLQSDCMLYLVFLLYSQGNSLQRILNVAAFAVSGYASSEGRHCKPFNPLLGETYEADYPDKGVRFFSEKVSL